MLYRSATLMDGSGGPARPATTVVVDGERIVRVAPDAEVLPGDHPGAELEDLTGRFVIPGLIDTHQHIATPPDRPLAEQVLRRDLLGGVTATRDMVDDLRQVGDIARAALVGEIAAPDICYAALTAGPGFFEDPRTWRVSQGATPGAVPWMQAITAETDLPLAVAMARGTFASAIKIYADLPAETVAALTAEAHRQGIGVWAHAAVFPAAPGENARDLLKVRTAADIPRAREEGRIGVVYGFQNAVAVGDDLDRIDLFGELGVRVIQLTYNQANGLGDGSMAPGNRGLTPFGREVVERLNEWRLMVDLSHSGERTCLDAVRHSTAPVSVNHTGCRAIADLPRNKTDEELRLVADRGGFVGVYFMPFLSTTGHARAEDVVEHLVHAVNVCGEDHVGIGTDGPVTAIDDLDAYRERLAAHVAERRAAGVSAAGERADTLPFVLDLRGVDQFRSLIHLLEGRGWTDRRIAKVMGVNFLAYAERIWAA
ncbi:membrane dipeptidase [Streptacidiphilus sp. EB129]|uniref:membrane dipeptidase n=1 Tax=Streptacidiphilus sp. EB129 TaxID=3156262 RepID=UPI00351173CA